MTKAIAVQPYVIIERTIANQAQISTAQRFELYLFNTKIVSSHREYPLHNVFDLSYKIISGEEGFLYLHTNQGVYAYIVQTDPSMFIKEFKYLRSLL